MKTIYLTAVLGLFSFSLYSQYPTLSGNNTFTGVQTFNENTYIATHKSIYMGDKNDSGKRVRFAHSGGDSYIDYGGRLYFRPSGNTSTSIHMDQYGNLSLGMSSFSQNKLRLTVNGKIVTNEIEVKTNVWADFVFDPAYELPSLKDVKMHIEENRHLPGIPSESEVLQNGINLSEMTAKLLQKVEELTLYVIDQHENAEKQQSLIDHLNKRINELESK
ncbi:MAG: hypothetical protein LUG18_15835 [Candidatus Azobacteroides sp.]|nr:hypothetical protein [Candidatus Azobacteroides sp.]